MLAAVALLAAACDGSAPGIAAGPTATAVGGAHAAAGGGTQASGLLAYASCMRSHGVPSFPDPAGSGGIPKQAVVKASHEVSSADLQAASEACYHLLPAGGSLSGKAAQTITVHQQEDYLAAAACMRSHGVASFPEPSFSNGQVAFPALEHVVNLDSPQFVQAWRSCGKLIPAGLPYSRPQEG